MLESDEDCVEAVGVGRGGRDVERVPTVIVDNTVDDWVPVCTRREEGRGLVDVASGRGLSKEPVMPSSLKEGEKAAYGMPLLSFPDAEITAM